MDRGAAAAVDVRCNAGWCALDDAAAADRTALCALLIRGGAAPDGRTITRACVSAGTATVAALLAAQPRAPTRLAFEAAAEAGNVAALWALLRAPDAVSALWAPGRPSLCTLALTGAADAATVAALYQHGAVLPTASSGVPAAVHALAVQLQRCSFPMAPPRRVEVIAVRAAGVPEAAAAALCGEYAVRPGGDPAALVHVGGGGAILWLERRGFRLASAGVELTARCAEQAPIRANPRSWRDPAGREAEVLFARPPPCSLKRAVDLLCRCAAYSHASPDDEALATLGRNVRGLDRTRLKCSGRGALAVDRLLRRLGQLSSSAGPRGAGGLDPATILAEWAYEACAREPSGVREAMARQLRDDLREWRGTPPMAAEAVSRLRLGPLLGVEASDSCTVCFEPLDQGNAGALPGCGHAFHRSCIERWLAVRGACPLCKQEVLGEGGGGLGRVWVACWAQSPGGCGACLECVAGE